jgi:hypothetical protein
MKTFLILLLLTLSPLAHGQTLNSTITITEPTHSFFDARNKISIGLSAASMITDALSTQHFLAYQRPNSPYTTVTEANPISRLFIGSRKGQAFISGLSFGTEVGAMAWLHRRGHHRLERLLPFVVFSAEASLAVNNYRLCREYCTTK